MNARAASFVHTDETIGIELGFVLIWIKLFRQGETR